MNPRLFATIARRHLRRSIEQSLMWEAYKQAADLSPEEWRVPLKRYSVLGDRIRHLMSLAGSPCGTEHATGHTIKL